MNRIATFTLITAGIVSTVAIPRIGHAQETYIGTVERVWEDGLRLNTGDRTFSVDSWAVYGDNTHNNITVGDRITVTGEFAGRSFDAFSITDIPSPSSNATPASPDAAPANTSAETPCP